MKTFAVTDTGALRDMNQDYYFLSDSPVGNLPNLFIVADGMGGHKAGDYASRFTTERIVAAVSRDPQEKPVRILKEAIRRANELLLYEAGQDPDKLGMGTTLVGVTIFDNELLIFNIGDSRLYIVGETIRQVTRDHSLVDEMVRMGEIDAEEARNHPRRNIITRAVGAAEGVEADFFEAEIGPDETILLCTDGLSGLVSDAEICRIMNQDKSLKEKAKTLVQTANANGGSDNITVMLIQPLAES